MTYEMKSLRKEDLSLYYYIKDTVLNAFVERETQVPLNLMPELCDSNSYVYEYVSDLEPSPTERGRGWRYFTTPSGGLPCEPYPTVSGHNGDGDPTDYGTPEQTNMVKVYETTVVSGVPTLTVVPDLVYMVDYVDGRIITETPLSAPAYVDFSWNYISVVDEWAAIEAADPPVVVVDMHGTDKAGYQLGGGKKANRKVDISLTAVLSVSLQFCFLLYTKHETFF